MFLWCEAQLEVEDPGPPTEALDWRDYCEPFAFEEKGGSGIGDRLAFFAEGGSGKSPSRETALSRRRGDSEAEASPPSARSSREKKPEGPAAAHGGAEAFGGGKRFSVDKELPLSARSARDSLTPRSEADSQAAAAVDSPRLYLYPNFGEPLDLFDSEDLLPDSLFLLLPFNPASPRGRRRLSVQPNLDAWLWVGADSKFSEGTRHEAAAAVSSAFGLQPEKLQLFVEVGCCRDASGVCADSPPTVERGTALSAVSRWLLCVFQREGEESDKFWSFFNNG